MHFLATKFEAFKGRGQNYLLGSRDIDNILNRIDGRAELSQELYHAADDVGREQLIFERIEKACK